MHKRCTREGFSRIRADGYTYCSPICRRLDEEPTTAHRVCEVAGNAGISSKFWVVAVIAAYAWTEYQRRSEKVHQIARLTTAPSGDQSTYIPRLGLRVHRGSGLSANWKLLGTLAAAQVAAL